MSENHRCPECGTELAASAPRGLCPACLLKRGLETNTAGFTGQQTESGAETPRWTPPAMEELAGRFPELEISRLIGRGGMGAVYQARQKNLDRVVALKILPPEIGHDAAFAGRFSREAQAMARLNHPHIVTIHEFGERGGLYYFVMEYVDGMSLRGLLDSGHVTPKEALAIVPQICEALQVAHEQGIVHRDIKPENILLNKQGQVKIADFGLAKLVGRVAGGGAGVTEKVMGTPQYMAPEQFERPAEVDHRADIYSLGVVFYQMLTGELPRGRFGPPSGKVQIDVRLDEVVLKALEREPGRRYQQVSEVRTEVEAIVGSPARADVRNDAPPASKQPAWHRIVAIVGTRNGVAVLNWPGVVFWLLGMGAVTMAAESIKLLAGHSARDSISVIFPLAATCLIVTGAILVGFSRPPHLLVSLDGAAGGPVPPDGNRQNADSETTPRRPAIEPVVHTSSSPPHFSRTAIAGVVWIVLFFAVVPALVVHQIESHKFWSQDPFLRLLTAFVSFVLILPALMAPVGATLCGWVALVKIRHSGGRLLGLSMALFDLLIFPLAALDAFLVVACCALVMWLTAISGDPGPWKIYPHPVLWALLTIASCLLVDGWIIRWAWRMVSAPRNGSTTPARRIGLVTIALIAVLVTVSVAAFYYEAGPRFSSQQAVSLPEQPANPPQLRFLGWRNENMDFAKPNLWHADGSPVTSLAELRLPGVVPPYSYADDQHVTEGSKLLNIWFSQPLFDEESERFITLFDASGRAIFYGNWDCPVHVADAGNDRLGWVADTLAPMDTQNIPSRVTVQLRYSAGPWENERELATDADGTMPPLSHGIEAAVTIGNSGDKAELILTSTILANAPRQFDVVAVTKDGRSLKASHRTFASDGMGNRNQAFAFDISLADIAHFQLASRPVWTVEFKDVVLKDRSVEPATTLTGTPEVIAMPPQLRFLAWQNENVDRIHWRAWHPDGSAVARDAELRLLGVVSPVSEDVGAMLENGRPPRFVYLWFSHPLFGPQSFNEVTLWDAGGQSIPTGGGGAFASNGQEASATNDQVGWLTDTLSPGNNPIPQTVTVRLRYSAGPMDNQRPISPNENGIITLGNGSQFSGVGQDASGKAFLAIAVDLKQDADRQFLAVAVLQDGREILSSATVTGGGVGEPVHVQRFSFDVPLEKVATFRLGTRAIRTIDFNNVVLKAMQTPEGK